MLAVARELARGLDFRCADASALPFIAGATGRVDFKDEVVTGEYIYRGHVSLR